MPIGDRQQGTGRLSEDALRRLAPPPAAPPQAAPEPAGPVGGGAPPADAALPPVELPKGQNLDYGQLPWGAAPAIDIGKELSGSAKGIKSELQNVTTALKSHLGLMKDNQVRVQQVEEMQKRFDQASAVFSVVGGMGTIAQGEETAQKGDVALGTATAAQGGLQAASGVFKLANNGMRSGQAMGASVIVGGIANDIKGVEDLKKGNYVQGGVELASGAIGTASGMTGLVAAATKGAATIKGATAAANDAAVREAMAGSVGRFAAPLTMVGAGIGGAMSVASGVQMLRQGKLVDGSLTIAQGALNSAAGAAFTINSIGTASEALQTFGKAAGPLGAAAGIVGGGMQVYDALSKNPPDYKSAALGATNAVASGMLLAPPPADIAGGAILIGTALYQNVKPVHELVDGAIGGAVEAGKGVVEGVADLASGEVRAGKDFVHGVAHAGHDLAHGHLLAAARDFAHGTAHAAEDVGKGAVQAAKDVAHGVESAASRVEKGVASAEKSVASGVHAVGHFLSNLF